jgi:hypothetical protein
MYVPENTKVIIITTDYNFNTNKGVQKLQEEFEIEYRRVTNHSIPKTQIVIVPNKLKEQFHDRAIITEGAGLDIGNSLNGLGKKRSKITVLNSEDAASLEKQYIDDMMNQATWFMQNGIQPTVLSIG